MSEANGKPTDTLFELENKLTEATESVEASLSLTLTPALTQHLLEVLKARRKARAFAQAAYETSERVNDKPKPMRLVDRAVFDELINTIMSWTV